MATRGWAASPPQGSSAAPQPEAHAFRRGGRTASHPQVKLGRLHPALPPQAEAAFDGRSVALPGRAPSALSTGPAAIPVSGSARSAFTGRGLLGAPGRFPTW